VDNLPRPSYVQVDNIQTIAKARFVKYMGALDASAMAPLGAP
jgi:mRNA-degrading endonuclease toxin of MazEF toxin-antitoxin module